MRIPDSARDSGISMVEVLVAMVVLSVGLLGLVVLQGRLQILQVESYQRSQALVLLEDMANRISLNRNNADDYLTTDPLGVGITCPTTTATRQEADTSEWCAALQGAAEDLGGSQVGAVVGGRGCVQDVGGRQYLITVAWQGMAPVSAPPAGVDCGEGLYDGDADSPCQDDLCRRVVTTVLRIADLSTTP
jgi:type IV pilus assembly protein PilV